MKHSSLTTKLSTADLQVYLENVLERADHHAEHVSKVVFPLLGAVIAFHDRQEGMWAQITPRPGSRNSRPAKVLRFSVNGHPLVFSYRMLDTGKKAVVLLDKNLLGAVRATFTNDTPTEEIYRVFSNLKAA